MCFSDYEKAPFSTPTGWLADLWLRSLRIPVNQHTQDVVIDGGHVSRRLHDTAGNDEFGFLHQSFARQILRDFRRAEGFAYWSHVLGSSW